VRYDPSVEGRYALFKQSIDELLNPGKRGLKSTLTTEPVILDVGIRAWDGQEEKTIVGTQLHIPAGVHAGFLSGFRHKLFARDFVNSVKATAAEANADGNGYVRDLKGVYADVVNGKSFVDAMMKRRNLLRERYWSCMEDFENRGHPFGTDLPEEEKRALTAFLATL
jgi:hypothetical protein